MEKIRLPAFFILFASAYCLSGCIAGDWKFREVNRVKSPNAEVEAVILTGDAGATTHKTTLVLIVPAGGHVGTNKPQENEIVFRADHLKNFNIVWKEPRLLEIQYEEAIISHFKNLEYILKDRDTWFAVEVRLAPLNPKFSVPFQDRFPQQ